MSQHIDQLFEKYLNGNCSTEEWQELLTLISQIEENDVDTLSAPMLQLWEKARNKELASTALLLERDKIYKAVTQPEESDLSPEVVPVAHRVHFLKTAWFRYAAAVILIATGVTIYLVNNDSAIQPTDQNAKKQQNDIQPGGDRAILTLADGKKIILDNAANGNLADQGNTKIIKLTSGQLAYNASISMRRGVEADPLYNTISTPRGGQYQIVLPDGSKVWLNAASSIKFPTAFTGERREVTVSGEAYMEIVKNTKQPFFVHTNKATLQVLGTSFNINAYTDEETEKTTLIEGSVKVVRDELSDKKSNQILLKPGQEAVLAPNSQLTTHAANIERALAWKNGVFQFDQATIPVVMRQLARWYDLEIHYADPMSIVDRSFKGKLQRSLPLSRILKLLEKGGINFKLEGRTLTVLP